MVSGTTCASWYVYFIWNTARRGVYSETYRYLIFLQLVVLLDCISLFLFTSCKNILHRRSYCITNIYMLTYDNDNYNIYQIPHRLTPKRLFSVNEIGRVSGRKTGRLLFCQIKMRGVASSACQSRRPKRDIKS